MDDALTPRLLAGERVALVSDAGTPLIADPGASLIAAAHTAGITVIPIPGACAAISALCVAGLGAGDMYFAGFLPTSGKERHSAIRKLVAMPTTLVLYEAPHRIDKTLAELADALGAERPAMLAREITKMHETPHRGTLVELAAITKNTALKGEMVLVIAPPEEVATDDALVGTMLRDALARLPATKAAAEVAHATGRARSDLYALALSFQRARCVRRITASRVTAKAFWPNGQSGAFDGKALPSAGTTFQNTGRRDRPDHETREQRYFCGSKKHARTTTTRPYSIIAL